jgi:hypothetical protein
MLKSGVIRLMTGNTVREGADARERKGEGEGAVNPRGRGPGSWTDSDVVSRCPLELRDGWVVTAHRPYTELDCCAPETSRLLLHIYASTFDFSRAAAERATCRNANPVSNRTNKNCRPSSWACSKLARRNGHRMTSQPSVRNDGT